MTRYRPGPNAHGARVTSRFGGDVWNLEVPGLLSPFLIMRDGFPMTKWLLATGIIEEDPEPVTDADVVAWLRRKLDEDATGEIAMALRRNTPTRLYERVRFGDDQ